MTRTDAHKQTIIDRLTDAAKPSANGDLYIRASRACKIARVGYGQRWQWEQTGKIKARRFRVEPRCGATIGVVVAWPLAQVTECVRLHRPMSLIRWSDREDSLLLKLLGRQKVSRVAEQLQRSVPAVRKRAAILGVNTRTNVGLMTTGTVAALCHRSRTAVGYWCLRGGLKFSRLPGTKGEKMIKPENLYAFLMSRPTIWSGLRESSRKRIELMAKDVLAPGRDKSKSAPEPRVYRSVAA